MAHKRPRSTFEADLQAKESPFVAYGTPLPPLDSEARDDGSYVPIWKQEVLDERGRKRLHGAFTGGYSAGYFNTVGSKDGWTPSTFVSSILNRHSKDDQKQQRPEDFMDDEDLQEQAEAQTLQTNQDFAGFGNTEQDTMRKAKVMDLFRNEGETMGVKLLRRMGWRDGQGIGPRVRRKARFDTDAVDDHEDHLFAPDDTRIATFARKDDRKGLGFGGVERLAENDSRAREDELQPEEDDHLPIGAKPSISKSKTKPRTPAFGMGVLNDTGSDDEDPYAMGPSISYNRVIGGNKKNQKPKASKPVPTPSPSLTSKPVLKSSNPLLTAKPVFKSTKLSTPSGFRRCHDGRLPLDGFLLSTPLDALSISHDAELYPLPVVPEGWKSVKAPSTNLQSTPYQSTADVAKTSQLDPKSRAALLGETPLPGKSVFDFLSPAQRERIVSASGRKDLPAARGEALPGLKLEEEMSEELPQVDKDTATAALGRGTGGWMPYTDDPAKRDRYRSFLELNAGHRNTLPPRPPEIKKTAWLAELREFAHAARVFRPVSGAMASRFQSSSSAPLSSAKEEILHVPMAKKEDPAEEAARLGMFGPLTRSVLTFYPTRLLCKRFNVKVPAHVNSQTEGTAPHAEGDAPGKKQTHEANTAAEGVNIPTASAPAGRQQLLLGMRSFTSGGIEHAPDAQVESEEVGGLRQPVLKAQAIVDQPPAAVMDGALDAQRAGEELFKAVFGDDSD